MYIVLYGVIYMIRVVMYNFVTTVLIDVIVGWFGKFLHHDNAPGYK